MLDVNSCLGLITRSRKSVGAKQNVKLNNKKDSKTLEKDRDCGKSCFSMSLSRLWTPQTQWTPLLCAWDRNRMQKLNQIYLHGYIHTCGVKNKRFSSTWAKAFSLSNRCRHMRATWMYTCDDAQSGSHVRFSWSEEILSSSLLLVATTIASRSTLFPQPVIFNTNTAFYQLQPVFIFLKDNSP